LIHDRQPIKIIWQRNYSVPHVELNILTTSYLAAY